MTYYHAHKAAFDRVIAEDDQRLRAWQQELKNSPLVNAFAPVEARAVSFGLYMDVNVPLPVTRGLRQRGVDVLTAQDDGMARFSSSFPGCTWECFCSAKLHFA